MQRIAKIIACILIVSYLMNTTVAAPLADNQQKQTGSLEKQNQKNSDHRKTGFSNKDVEMWTNPCNAISILETNISADPKASYGNIELLIEVIANELEINNKINSSNYEAWQHFNGRNYEFLPKKPTGNHRQWHFDMQKYVAAFILLKKNQVEDDLINNNNTMSEELSKILQNARELLCEIEHFVNATSSQKIGTKDWIRKGEMKKYIEFQNLTAMFLHRTFTKGRFQDYIKKLYNRIKTQSAKNYVEKQVTYPKLKSIKKNKQQGTRRARKGNRRNQNGRKNEQQYEVSATKRVHIVRTSKMPAQSRNNNNKNNNNQRRRQRTKTTTTTIATV